jgi:predicted RNA-binding protein with EMAP domain
MNIVNEIILTRVTNQLIGEIKNALRRGETTSPTIKTAKRAWNTIENKAYVRGLNYPEINKEELKQIGGLTEEEINDLLEEEKALHTAFLRLWEEVEVNERMELKEALELLSESSKEALKRTGLRMTIRGGGTAGIELLTLLRTVG